jgi:hypothetical protein
MTPTLPVKTSKFKKKPGIEQDRFLVFDLESDGLYDEVTKVFCIVIYDINRKQTFTYGPDRIDAALNHLATADALIGHNIILTWINKNSEDLACKELSIQDGSRFCK